MIRPSKDWIEACPLDKAKVTTVLIMVIITKMSGLLSCYIFRKALKFIGLSLFEYEINVIQVSESDLSS